jgi:hypothetical protein
VGEGNPRILHRFYGEVRFGPKKWAVDNRWKTGTETKAGGEQQSLGQVCEGLVMRRQAEVALWRGEVRPD